MRRKYAVVDVPNDTAEDDVLIYDAVADLWTARSFDHDHTATGDGGVLTNDVHDGYIDVDDITIPAVPSIGTMRLWSQDIHDYSFPTLIMHDGDEIILGQDIVVVARNNTGVQIDDGTPVYVIGATGNIPNVAPADASVHATMPAIGLVIENIGDTLTGLVQSAGTVTYNTSGPGWSLGDAIYISETTGTLTNVEPSFPALQQHIGYVTVVGVGNGKILLFGGDTHEQVDHDDLANVTADNHHVKYTDAEVDAIVATHAAESSAHHAVGGGPAEGTTFPGSPSTRDRYFRTDIKGGMYFFYDGTRWVSEIIFQSVGATALDSWPLTDPGGQIVTVRGVFDPDFDCYAIKMVAGHRVETTNDGSHYYTVYCLYQPSGTDAGNYVTSGWTVDVFTFGEIALADVISSSDSTDVIWQLRFNDTGSPGTVDSVSAFIDYRLIAT